MKKIISVLLALLVCFSLPISSFAAGEPTFEVSSASAKVGDTVNVNITIKNNPGIASAKLAVTFDGQLKLEKIDYGKKLSGGAEPQKLISPVTLNWISYTSELKDDAVFATLTFTVLKDAKEGEHKIELSYNPEDVYNKAEKNVNFKTVAGVITVSGGAAAGNAASASSVTITASNTNATGTASSNSSDKKTSSVENASNTSVVLTAESAVTTGENKNESKGDYTGEEEILEFVDEKGNPVDGVTSKPISNTKTIWIISIIAAVLILGATAFVIFKKYAAKPKEKE